MASQNLYKLGDTKKQAMTKVMVFGTFDFVHPGHINFFQQARQHGDKLVVVIARDSTAEKIKGKKPTFSEQDRLQMVQALRIVDKAVMGYPGDVYRIVREENPEVICLGYDQKTFADKLPDKLKELGMKARIFRLEPYMPEQYKSTIIRKAIAREPSQ